MILSIRIYKNKKENKIMIGTLGLLIGTVVIAVILLKK